MIIARSTFVSFVVRTDWLEFDFRYNYIVPDIIDPTETERSRCMMVLKLYKRYFKDDRTRYEKQKLGSS
jgi:hypothetical protein